MDSMGIIHLACNLLFTPLSIGVTVVMTVWLLGVRRRVRANG